MTILTEKLLHEIDLSFRSDTILCRASFLITADRGFSWSPFDMKLLLFLCFALGNGISEHIYSTIIFVHFNVLAVPSPSNLSMKHNLLILTQISKYKINNLFLTKMMISPSSPHAHISYAQNFKSWENKSLKFYSFKMWQ